MSSAIERPPGYPSGMHIPESYPPGIGEDERMSDVIEPTAVIGPDGALRTGWELPEPIIFAFDFGAAPPGVDVLAWQRIGQQLNYLYGIPRTGI